jgi:branched-chain amino acid transport system substrate-binding protein
MRVLTLLVVSSFAVMGCQKFELARRPAPVDPAQPQAAATPAPASATTQATSSAKPAATATASPAGSATAAAAPQAAATAIREDASPTPPVPLRLGVLVPLRGRYAAYGKAYLDGAQLAADAANRRATRRIEIVPADAQGEQGEAAAAMLATRRLVQTEGLVAILGSVQSVPTLVAALEANCSGVPLVSNVAADDGIGNVGPWVFHAVPSRLEAAGASAELTVRALKRQRAAILFPEEGDGQALALAFSDRLAALGGEVVFSEAFVPGTTDFTLLARQIATANPEVLYVPASTDDLVLIVPALTYQGVTAQIIGTEDLGATRLLETDGIELEGALVPAPPADGSDAELAAFRNAYKQTVTPTEKRLAAAGWMGARAVLDAIAQTPVVDRDAVQRGLEARRKARPSAGARSFLVVHQKALQPFTVP